MRWWFVLLVGCSGSSSPQDSGATPPTGVASNVEGPDVEGVTAAHNLVRTALGIPDLTWRSDLATGSADWLVELDNDDCALEHNFQSDWGENLYWSSVPTPPQEVVSDWASEVADYDYASNSCAPNRACGHYTQIVWADTTHVGCARRRCAGGLGELWMCSYDPPGNFVGEQPY